MTVRFLPKVLAASVLAFTMASCDEPPLYDVPDDMVVLMDREGNVLKGTHEPSSEMKMHVRV